MKNLFIAFTVALLATPVAAQTTQQDEAFIEKAWADGILNATEKAEIARISERSEQRLANKVAGMRLSANGQVYSGELGYLDPRANPWKAVTAADWNRLDRDNAKAQWRLVAQADYNGDRKPDVAQLFSNGRQTAVLVQLAGSTQPMIIYKADGVKAGAEIRAAGNRFLLSIPDTSPIVLFTQAGKPAVAYLGD